MGHALALGFLGFVVTAVPTAWAGGRLYVTTEHKE